MACCWRSSPNVARAPWSGADRCYIDVRQTIGNAYVTTILEILQILLNLVWWVIIVQAILSWLIAFNVINTSNDLVRNVWQALGVMTEPLYRPIRRVLPDFGALDLSPVVVLIILAILDVIIRNQLIAAYTGA
ncbi:YggT family protein [Roseomonas aeriglobus]|nr:YggT family protein [Roseomonas aeriglobus]